MRSGVSAKDRYIQGGLEMLLEGSLPITISIADVAKAQGVSEAAIYKQWPGKAGLRSFRAGVWQAACSEISDQELKLANALTTTVLPAIAELEIDEPDKILTTTAKMDAKSRLGIGVLKQNSAENGRRSNLLRNLVSLAAHFDPEIRKTFHLVDAGITDAYQEAYGTMLNLRGLEPVPGLDIRDVTTNLLTHSRGYVQHCFENLSNEGIGSIDVSPFVTSYVGIVKANTQPRT